jgi:ADP-ribose pyrophosphatase YjhB (NUDIX family)
MHEMRLTPGIDFVGVGVGGVIVRQSKILLLLRKKPPECNHWTIPGGAIEFGEKVEDALLRELIEEIGVQTRIVAPLGLTDQILPLEGTHWVSLRFLVEIVAGEPENACPESHSRIAWFPLEALPAAVTITTREAVVAYRAWSKNSGL